MTATTDKKRRLPFVESIVGLFGLVCGITSAGGRDDLLHNDRSDDSGAWKWTKRTRVDRSPSKDVEHVCVEICVKIRRINSLLQVQCH